MKVVCMTVTIFAFSAVRNILAFKVTAVSYIKLFAYNRIYSVCMAYMLKIKYTEHVSVVCKRKGRHVKSFCLCNKRVKFSTAVQK